jgi:transposase InsO family protein
MPRVSIPTLLHKIYYNPKTGYGSANILYKQAHAKNEKITHKHVHDWLQKQELTQITRKPAKRQSMKIVSTNHKTFQADLAFLPKYKPQNKGYYVLLTLINVNTRRGYAYISKNKKTDSILKMIQKFIDETHPHTLMSDNGSEFISAPYKKLMKDNNIKQVFAQPEDHRALGLVERFNRSVKQLIQKHMSNIGEPVWYNVIDDLIENYNNRFHSGIKMTPNQVTPEIEQSFIDKNRAYNRAIRESLPVFPIGARVRVLEEKKMFDKGDQRYSDIKYTITESNNFNTKYRVEGKRKWYKYYELLVVPDANIPLTRAAAKARPKREKQRAAEKQAKAAARLARENL